MVARLAVALVLASSISVFAQPVLKTANFTLNIADGTLVEVLDLIGRTTGVDIQIDQSVAAEVKNEKLKDVSFQNAQLEDALRFLASRRGLTLEVIDEKTVRIRAKQ